MPPDPLLAGLDPEQRAAVTHPAPLLAILAPAGSGKTRVLTRRIAWRAREGLLDAAHVLAVTFTRKAAGELRSRLARLGVPGTVTAGTFHALALAELRRRAAAQGRDVPQVLEHKARILAPMLAGTRAERSLAAAEVAGEIEWAKARLVGPDGFVDAAAAAGRRLPRPAGELAALYQRYEEEKRRRRLADFDDLLAWCAQALERDGDFAASARWRYRHLFVDEFQDVSPAQMRVVRGWLGDRDDLCVVGDEAQAIYSFAGADPSYLRDFAHHFPGATVARLATNYRSTPQVVSVSTAVLDGVVRRPATRSRRDDGPAPGVVAYDTDGDEARGVARTLRGAHHEGAAWSHMAVLYRTNAQSPGFEAALRTAGIPFRLPGAGRFVDRPEVRVALDSLRSLERASPGTPFAQLLAGLAAGDADPDDRADPDADGEASGVASERHEHVAALVHLGREYLEGEPAGGSLSGFLDWLDTATRGDDGGDAERDAVALLTFHKAKGLEWRVVCVTGLELGLVPISYAVTPEARDEEQRLLHVALSRAEHRLHCSWARVRAVGGRRAARKPSPWLALIDARARAARGAPPDPRAAVAEIRRHLHAADRPPGPERPELPPADRALFERLREWRGNLARANAVPAYVIFSDETLRAIAGARPRNRQDLLALPGIGPVKAERYGPEVLTMVGAAERG